MHCSILDSICTTKRNLQLNNLPTVEKKQSVVLIHFLTLLCWQHNKDYLCHWLMIEMLAHQATGLPPMVTTLAIERHYATSTCHAFATLDEYSDQGSRMLAAAIASETTLSAGVDNYNRSRNKTFQAGDKFALMHKVTVMHIWWNMLPCLSLGLQLLDTFTSLVFCVTS
jgi:hypothetical protein